MTLAEALPANGPTFRDRTGPRAYSSRTTAEKTTITYSELDSCKARSIAARLLAGLVEPGDRAMLVYPAGIDFVAAFLRVPVRRCRRNVPATLPEAAASDATDAADRRGLVEARPWR